jgi:galactose-1-phosphate uridylyltransferase
MKSRRRVYEDQNIAIFTHPMPSAYHYEVWIFTKRQVNSLTKLSKSEIKSVAKGLKNDLRKT